MKHLKALFLGMIVTSFLGTFLIIGGLGIGCGGGAASTSTTASSSLGRAITGTFSSSGASLEALSLGGKSKNTITVGGKEIASVIATFTDATTAKGDVGADGAWKVTLTADQVTAGSCVLSAIDTSNKFAFSVITDADTFDISKLTETGKPYELGTIAYDATTKKAKSKKTFSEIAKAAGIEDWNESNLDCAKLGFQVDCHGGCKVGDDFKPEEFKKVDTKTLKKVACNPPDGSKITSDTVVEIDMSRDLNTTSISKAVKAVVDGASSGVTTQASDGPFGQFATIKVTPVGEWSGSSIVVSVLKGALKDTDGNTYDTSDSCSYTLATASEEAAALKLAASASSNDNCKVFKPMHNNCPASQLAKTDPKYDSDCDCVPDVSDNCPNMPNPEQIPFCDSKLQKAMGSIVSSGQPFDPMICGCDFDDPTVNPKLKGDFLTACTIGCKALKKPPASCRLGGGFGPPPGAGGPGGHGPGNDFDNAGGGFCKTDSDCASLGRFNGPEMVCKENGFGFNDCKPKTVKACTCKPGVFGGGDLDCGRDEVECDSGPCNMDGPPDPTTHIASGHCDPYFVKGQGFNFLPPPSGGTSGPGAPQPFQPFKPVCKEAQCDLGPQPPCFADDFCKAFNASATCKDHRCTVSCTSDTQCQNVQIKPPDNFNPNSFGPDLSADAP